VLRAMQARIEWRLHQTGAEARLREAIAGMRAAGVSGEEVASFRKELR
jgi:hypothetical protein